MSFLKPEDYLEPACPLCMEGEQAPVHRIDVCRMLEKLDEYLSRNDYDAAARHLDFWLGEARYNNDRRGELAVWNEKMGLHRKRGQEAEAMDAAQRALNLVAQLQMQDTLTAGTTYLNAATVYKAFGRAKDALPLYEAAKNIYLAALPENDPRLGGLYNNMGLALADEKRFREARDAYQKAIAIMARTEHGQPEQAITWLNLADLAEEELGLLESEAAVTDCLDRAEALLDTPGLPRNGNYAFVCEKCAPTFQYFGRFAFAEELLARSREIYERA